MSAHTTSAPGERLRDLLGGRETATFAEVMEEALYGRDGYYDRPEVPIGPRGDFVTGSSLSELFGRATSRLLARLDRQLDRPAVLLDAGCGNGRHLQAIHAVDRDRHLYGWDRIERPLPEGARRVGSLSELPRVEGVVFSYELFDALPVHRLVGTEDGESGEAGVGELHVGVAEDGVPEWRLGELSDPALLDLLGERRLEVGQIADLAPGWVPLYHRLAGALERGLLVTFDYGYERDRLLDPRIRRHGTLACYRAHRVHRDALSDLGRQDLTAHVDFTALREAGEAAGLETVAFTRQALWLTALGLFDDLGPEAETALRLEAAALLDPEGMGDQIRVLIQARDVDVSSLVDLALLGGARGARDLGVAEPPRAPGG